MKQSVEQIDNESKEIELNKDNFTDSVYNNFINCEGFEKTETMYTNSESAIYQHRAKYIEAIKLCRDNIKELIRKSLNLENNIFERYVGGYKNAVYLFQQNVYDTKLGMQIQLEYCRIFIYSAICNLDFTEKEISKMRRGSIYKALENTTLVANIKLDEMIKCIENLREDMMKYYEIHRNHGINIRTSEGNHIFTQAQTVKLEREKNECSYNERILNIFLMLKSYIIELDTQMEHDVESDEEHKSELGEAYKILTDLILRLIQDITNSYLGKESAKECLNKFYMVQAVKDLQKHPMNTIERYGVKIQSVEKEYVQKLWRSIYTESSVNSAIVPISLTELYKNYN